MPREYFGIVEELHCPPDHPFLVRDGGESVDDIVPKSRVVDDARRVQEHADGIGRREEVAREGLQRVLGFVKIPNTGMERNEKWLKSKCILNVASVAST